MLQMQEKFDMFTQSHWFLGAKAENLKHVTSIHTKRELFRIKVMIVEEKTEILSRMPAQLELFAASNQQPLNINIVGFC